GDVDAVVAEARRVRPALVPQHVAATEDDERRRRSGQGLGEERRRVRIAADVAATRVALAVELAGLAADDEAVELDLRRELRSAGHAGVEQRLPGQRRF